MNNFSNDMNPNVAPTPGERIEEELKRQGLTEKMFSEISGISAHRVHELITGQRPITRHYAMKLERFLGIPASSWR